MESGQQASVADRELDARGLNCPLPILHTKRVLKEMSSGQTLRVLSTDPGSIIDFQVFAMRSGHELLELKQGEGEFSFLLKKA